MGEPFGPTKLKLDDAQQNTCRSWLYALQLLRRPFRRRLYEGRLARSPSVASSGGTGDRLARSGSCWIFLRPNSQPKLPWVAVAAGWVAAAAGWVAAVAGWAVAVAAWVAAAAGHNRPNRLGQRNFRRSNNRARRLVLIGCVDQIELHPRNVVPAVVLPFDAAM
jgi:hypothetical protein